MGTIANPEGITNPPIDELLDKTSSKYSLVIFAAKRARQVNAYYSQLGEGLLEYVGPLVETTPQEKPLSIAMREINAGLLTAERPTSRRRQVSRNRTGARTARGHRTPRLRAPVRDARHAFRVAVPAHPGRDRVADTVWMPRGAR